MIDDFRLVAGGRRVKVGRPRLGLLLWVCCGLLDASASDRLFLPLDPRSATPTGYERFDSLVAWRPDLLTTAAYPTAADAAAELRRAVLAEFGEEPLPVRLDAFDLYRVGDCETCAPPPEDPHRWLDPAAPPACGPDLWRFARAATAALAGTRARPYVVVPAGAPAPTEPLPASLLVLVRGGSSAGWEGCGADVHPLVEDPCGRFAGLPLCGDVLPQPPRVALLVRAADVLSTHGPDWLAERLRAVAAGAVDPAGDAWRTDQPMLARIVDVFAPLRPRLRASEPGQARALATLDALDAVRAWERQPAAATRAALLAALDRVPLEEPAGPLSPAFRQAVAAGSVPPTVRLPRLAQVVVDGEQRPGEWAGALMVRVRLTDDGEVSPRTAVVRLADSGDRLVAAVEASEPRPAEAGLRDALVLSVADTVPGAPAWRLTFDVGGRVLVQRVARPGAAPEVVTVAGARAAGVLEAPGWQLEACAPWAALALSPSAALRLQVGVVHRRGRVTAEAVWRPTYGRPWSAHGWAWLRPTAH